MSDPTITDADLRAAARTVTCPRLGENEDHDEAVGCQEYYDHGSCVHTYLRELRAVVALAAERAAAVTTAWAANYPTDVFPEPQPGMHGNSVDACSARAERHAAKGIAAEIRRALTGGKE